MASTSFDDTNWTGYDEYDSNSSVISSSNDNLLIDLGVHASADFWSNVKSDGGDIRVTNSAGDTAYSYELENFDNTAETGILFFNSQGLSTSSDTTYRVYAGNGSASLPADSDTLGAENVWGSFVRVYHFSESSGSAVKDSSGNGDGTYNGALPTQVSGNFGDAQSLDGTADWIDSNYNPSTENPSEITVISWWSIDDTDGTQLFGGFDGTNQWFMRASPNKIEWYTWDGTFYGIDDASVPTLSPDTWYQHVGVFDSANGYEYFRNGTSEASNSDTTFLLPNITMGVGAGNRGGSINDPVPGDISEFRMAETSLSSNYISTEYENQANNSNFWTNNGWTANDQPGRIGERNSNGIGIRTSAGIGKTD